MKPRKVAVVSLVLAVIFGIAGIAKLSGAEVVAEQFRRWGYPESVMLAVGSFELLGAIGLLVPRIASVAAICLMLIMLGAIYTHLFKGFAPLAIVPVVTLVALGWVAKHRLESRQSWVLRQRELF